MQRTIRINGTKIKVTGQDIDGDGEVGGTEEIQKQTSVIPARESTELGDAITEFNKDDVTEDRLSSIDFRSRIDPYEIVPMVALDTTIGMQVCPTICGVLNRVKMRKSVSLKGEGRKEFVEVVVGKREQDNNGLKKGFGNFMGANKDAT